MSEAIEYANIYFGGATLDRWNDPEVEMLYSGLFSKLS